MKHLVIKLFFIVILVLGISSFAVIKNNNKIQTNDKEAQEKVELKNNKFSTEKKKGFSDRERPF